MGAEGDVEMVSLDCIMNEYEIMSSLPGIRGGGGKKARVYARQKAVSGPRSQKKKKKRREDEGYPR